MCVSPHALQELPDARHPQLTKTTYTVDNSDLEAFVQATYPDAREYSFAADTEGGNDSVHSFDLDGSPLDEWGQKKVVDFAAGKHVRFVTRYLLQDMCARGLIPAGNWLVHMSW